MGAVTRDELAWLTQQACFAADQVAMEHRRSGEMLTGAEQTRGIVERTIEFLIGNGLIEVTLPADGEGVWMKVEPPYDADRIVPA